MIRLLLTSLVKFFIKFVNGDIMNTEQTEECADKYEVTITYLPPKEEEIIYFDCFEEEEC